MKKIYKYRICKDNKRWDDFPFYVRIIINLFQFITKFMPIKLKECFRWLFYSDYITNKHLYENYKNWGKPKMIKRKVIRRIIDGKNT